MKFSGIISIQIASFLLSLLATSEIEGFTPAFLRQSQVSVGYKGFNSNIPSQVPRTTKTQVLGKKRKNFSPGATKKNAKVVTEKESTVVTEVAEAETEAEAEEEGNTVAEEAVAVTPEQKYYARLEARKAAIESTYEDKTEAEYAEIEAKYNAIEDVSTRAFTVARDLGLIEEEGLDEDDPDYWDGLDDEMVPIKDSKGNEIKEWP